MDDPRPVGPAALTGLAVGTTLGTILVLSVGLTGGAGVVVLFGSGVLAAAGLGLAQAHHEHVAHR